MISARRIAWPLVVVLAFSAGATWHLAWGQSARPKVVQKWEYKASGFSAVTFERLGDDGWELVAVAGQPNSDAHFYFKRPK